MEYTVANNIDKILTNPKKKFIEKIPTKQKNSPIKPLVNGKAILANEKKKKKNSKNRY